MKFRRHLVSAACLLLVSITAARANVDTPSLQPSAFDVTALASAAGATRVAGIGASGPELEEATIADLLSADVREADAGSIVSRVADLISARTGRSPMVAAPASAGNEDAAEPTEDERLVVHAPAGDLDGDGSADTVEYDVAFSEGLVSIELHAVAGNTGATLWTRGSPDADAALGFPLEEDVTGDGSPDLISLALTTASSRFERDDCPEHDWDCPFTYDRTHRWTLSVISGADGALAWRTTRDGDLHIVKERTSGPIAAVALETSNVYRLQAASLYFIPFLAGDHDGDGLGDLVVTILDSDIDDRRSKKLLDESSSLTVRNASHLEVRSLADGRVLSAAEVPRGPVTAVALPAGNAVGSGAPDLMWERYVEPDRSSQCTLNRCTSQGAASHVEVAMIDGATKATAWTVTRPGGWVETLLADVDADGSDDVFFSAGGSPFGDGERTMVSGRDGRTLWQAPGYGGVFSTHELDGAAGRDVLLIEVVFDADGFGVHLERRVGSTGAQLASSTHRMDMDTPGSSSMFIESMGDADGDGVDDLSIGTVSGSQPEEGGPVLYRSRAVAESGRTAAAIRTWVVDRPLLLIPAGDVDGDGRENGMLATFDFHDTDYTVALDVINVIDGAALWSTSATGRYVAVATPGDQDGDGGSEVVVSATGGGGNPLAKLVQSHRGTTGALRWSRTD